MPAKKPHCKNVRALAFPAPVLKEDRKAYDDLVTEVINNLKPTNIIEMSWVHSISNSMWNIVQLGHAKGALIERALPKALEEMLTPLMADASRFGSIPRYDVNRCLKPTPVMELINAWMQHRPEALEKADAMLTSAELTMQDVKNRAYVLEIEKLQKFEQLTENAEARFNSTLREMDHHRAMVAQGLRKAAKDVIDAEFNTIPPKALT